MKNKTHLGFISLIAVEIPEVQLLSAVVLLATVAWKASFDEALWLFAASFVLGWIGIFLFGLPVDALSTFGKFIFTPCVYGFELAALGWMLCKITTGKGKTLPVFEINV